MLEETQKQEEFSKENLAELAIIYLELREAVHTGKKGKCIIFFENCELEGNEIVVGRKKKK